MEWIFFTISGFGVGALVGLTGVGGGSLMTPLLIFLFNIAPLTAVGTDLIFAAITKAGGIWSHQKRNNICWNITGLMALGSLPTALLTVYLLGQFTLDGLAVETLIHVVLGIALMLTSMAILFKTVMHDLGEKVKTLVPQWIRYRAPVTVLAGIILGVLVPISSIGAGALGAAMLLFLYPSLPTMKIVGTDLAHAVPLTAIAGLGHIQMGSVDFTLLTYLLVGSLPGIYVGSHMSTIIPEKVMRPILASMLMLIGVKFIFTH